ncbi:MAG: hypothetical protein E4H20_07060 [Spirochaetales bacterium]|nr:MAG: hypothetical protein E4H20_07060 [Spirochaetales bacterium]
MTFDQFAEVEKQVALRGDELAGVYLALVEREVDLDRYQRKALENLRCLLYDGFSIEEMESLGESYARRLSDPDIC